MTPLLRAGLGLGAALAVLALTSDAPAVDAGNLVVTDVAPRSFVTALTLAAPASATLHVYTDAAQTAEVTGSVEVELYPLQGGFGAVAGDDGPRAAGEALRSTLRAGGIVVARVSQATPGATYYLRWTVERRRGDDELARGGPAGGGAAGGDPVPGGPDAARACAAGGGPGLAGGAAGDRRDGARGGGGGGRRARQ
jgi:hypothetical protein